MPDRADVASTGTTIDALEPRLLFAADPVSTFLPPLTVPQLGSLNQVVAKGDFNGDGYLDLAASGGDYDKSRPGQPFVGRVQVLLNDRTGRFTPAGQPRVLAVGATAMIAGDLNGDGATDLAVAAGGIGGGVFVYLGDGRGNLGGGALYAANEARSEALVLGDFNGDGRTDIAAAGYRVLSTNPSTGASTLESQVAVLLNAGGGAFFSPVLTHIAGSTQMPIAAINYDNDARTDLAIGSVGQTQFLTSKGDGTFNFPAAIAGGGVFASADLNRDGRPDLVWGRGATDTIRYSLSRAQGGFTSPVAVPAGGVASSTPTLGDFDGDGRVDVYVGTSETSTRGLFLQTPGGGFQEVASFGTLTPALAGDFNNDGRDDIVSTVTTTRIYLAVPPSVFTTPRRTLVIDGTRRADVVSVAVSGSRILITLNGETVAARLSRVRRIQITTGLGRDVITIDPSVFSPALISAGGDGDTVTGGSGDDTIQGDNGSDELSGGAGVDLIQGGKGLDTLDGGSGADSIFGGRDEDTFAAGDSLRELLDRTADEPVV